MNEAINYLRQTEWSMGHNQCPVCCGVAESWLGHPLHLTPKTIGHDPLCALAKALMALGQEVIVKGTYKSNLEYESYIAENGLRSTRPKTAKGCPRLSAENEVRHTKIKDILFKFLTQKK